MPTEPDRYRDKDRRRDLRLHYAEALLRQAAERL
jgi:hypothetical protein